MSRRPADARALSSFLIPSLSAWLQQLSYGRPLLHHTGRSNLLTLPVRRSGREPGRDQLAGAVAEKVTGRRRRAVVAAAASLARDFPTWFVVPADGAAEKLAQLAANPVTGSSVDYAMDGEQVTTKLGLRRRGRHRLRRHAAPEHEPRRDHL